MRMKKVNVIRIFSVLTVLFAIGCYQILNENEKNDLPLETETQEALAEEEGISEPETERAAVPVSQVIEYKFVIVEEGDYLTVYFADKTTVYEYTDIRYSDLEDTLRQKIRKGYWIEDEDALFGFLEDYSS